MMSAVENTQTMDNEYLTFYIGKELVAIKLKFVETIEFITEIIPIPRAPPHVTGVAKIENSIIPIINLDVLLNCDVKRDDESPIAVIISIDTAVFGIYISEPPKVTTTDLSMSEVTGYKNGEIPIHWFLGQMKLDGLSFFVLDPTKFWIGLGTSEIVGPSSNIDLGTIKTTSTPAKIEEPTSSISEKKPISKKELKTGLKKNSKKKKVEDKSEVVTEVKLEELDPKTDVKLADEIDEKDDAKKKKVEEQSEIVTEAKLNELDPKIDVKLADEIDEKDDTKKKGKKKKAEEKSEIIVEIKSEDLDPIVDPKLENKTENKKKGKKIKAEEKKIENTEGDSQEEIKNP
ncbi:MAG: hypothetical protein HeimC2_45100 [Candidatus Heimdallarchaeota archaeon LC_2]|nr:MAG: hypothetical protein HeimC2_45100 [Candidatus Heimdallarchaeota archaeon LC_2]